MYVSLTTMDGALQCVVDRLRLMRRYGGVFQRGHRLCGGSRTSDTSSGAGYSPYSSIYSASSSVYSSLSDVSSSAPCSLNVDFDVSEAAVTTADSDAEDGFIELMAPLQPVSVACRRHLRSLASPVVGHWDLWRIQGVPF